MGFQSAPPRGGRRKLHLAAPAPRLEIVSIRAPARGATACAAGWERAGTIMFQSAPPRGGRPENFEQHKLFYFHEVSIRAPARGATQTGFADEVIATLLFQSAPPRGGRLGSTNHVIPSLPFQSAPPRGGRHHAQRKQGRHAVVSIRAPARGATRESPGDPGPVGTWVSIRAPARGATSMLTMRAPGSA